MRGRIIVRGREPGFWFYWEIRQYRSYIHVFRRRFLAPYGNGGWSWGVTVKLLGRFFVSEGKRR